MRCLVTASMLLFAVASALGLSFPPRVHAGAFHRCDDGSGVAIYQTRACDAGTRTVARVEYMEAESAPEPAVENDRGHGKPRGGRGAGARPREDSKTAAPTAATRRRSAASSRSAPARAVAYECRQSGASWVQSEPCAGGDAGAATQRAVAGAEVCDWLRSDARLTAPGARESDAAYQRNRLRDRANC